jgi:hypothetical protein
MFLVVATLLSAGCESLRHDLTPMTDSEAEIRSRNDPGYAPPIPTPWERERYEQERRWQEDRERR